MTDPDRFPRLDDLIAGRKLWSIWVPAPMQKKKMKEIYKEMSAEHDILLEEEPQDEFHACVLLGAMNLISGLLDLKG